MSKIHPEIKKKTTKMEILLELQSHALYTHKKAPDA